MKNKQNIGASPLWQNKQINKDSVAAVNAWNKMKSGYMNRTHKFKGRPNERPLSAEENLAEWNMEKNEFYYDTNRNKLRLIPTDDGEIPIKGFKEGLNKWQLAPLNQKVITKEPKVDIGTAYSVSPGYEPLEMITGREKAKKIKGKLGRKQRKLAKTDRQMQDIGNRIMFEKTPDTISQKADRKMKKYFKTKNQINEIKNNK